MILGSITGDLASRVSLNSEASSVSTTIAASDPITVSLSGPATVGEGDETSNYTVSLSGGTPTADLTVDYATADGTAEAGSDYTAKSGTLTFTAADHADKTFTVQTTEDTESEEGETFTVTLSNAAGGGDTPVLGATSSITTTIEDAAGITLSVGTASLSEGASATDITVTATLGDERASDVTVNISLGGTAGSGDYSSSGLSSITIDAGDSSGSGTLKVTPTDDGLVEGDETITVSGSAGDDPVSPAEITITDNDTATLSVSGPSGEITEGSNAEFTVTLSHSVNADVTVSWSASSGSAAASDFSASPSTVTFAAGSGASATRTVSISTTEDDLSESAEDFSVSLGTITGDLSDLVSLKSGESSASATIAASDPITVSLSGPAIVDEGSETSAYTVSLSGGTPTANLTVDYATADGTAQAGSDYTTNSGTLTFTSADHADKTFTVQTSADTLNDGDETFSVSLSSATGGGGPAPALGTSLATTTIRDTTPAPTVRGLSAPSYEENGASAVATYAADFNSGSISWTLEGTDASDFSISGSGALSFNSTPDFESPADADSDNEYHVTMLRSRLPTAPENGTSDTYTASDPEGATISWTLEGTDASDFSISGSGALSFNSTPDFESPADADSDNEYHVTIKASDGSNSATLDVTVTVIDDNEAPSITGGPTSPSYTENGTSDVATYTASDPEGATISWTLEGTDGRVSLQHKLIGCAELQFAAGLRVSGRRQYR